MQGKVDIIEGIVVRGNEIGRKLGFPTANIRLDDDTLLRSGVYEVSVLTSRGTYRGMANVGTRPTVTDKRERFLEVNIFDFSGDLYGEKITVELLRFIRDERPFPSKEELRRQIELDREFILNNKN